MKTKQCYDTHKNCNKDYCEKDLEAKRLGNSVKGPETQHTPTPWHRNVSPAYKYPIYADKNGDPNGRDWIHIAAVLSGNPNAEADLDFIVRAVNSHGALLRAAVYALNELQHPHPNPENKALTINELKEVIKQAEGK